MKEEPALSPSIAHVLDSESPLHAWTIHRLLGNRPRPVTDVQEKGSLIDALLFDQKHKLVRLPFDNFRSKDAQAARDEARAAGKIPIVEPKYIEAEHIAGHIGKRIAELGISLENGRCQERLEWREDDVLCHGVLDWVSDDWRHIIDLKTSDASAHPAKCARRLLDSYGIMQDAAYRHAVETLHPELAGRVEMTFLFAETRDPYAVTEGVCSGELREIGEMRWARALRTWRKCLATNTWPAYTEGTVRLEAPGWAIAQELERETE